MATFPCENKSLCVDPATPFQNFSAEAPDGHIAIARSTGFGPSYPPLGSDFFAVGCTVFCESTESQEDADQCAARNWVDCVSVVWPVWRPVVDVFGNRVFAPFPRPVFVNAAQTATVFCPDGNPFSFTVPAGRYAAFNQSQADDAAFSAALDKAEQFKLCITDLSHPQVCADSAYADSVTAIGNFLNTDTTCWQIFGTLPPGIDTDLDLSFQGCLTGDNTFHFFGSPTTPGDYSFSIQVTDDVGSFMVKQLTIRVMGITTDSLPNGVPFTPYSEFLDAAGVTNPIFAIESGTLPAGMAFDTASGQIFGTPIAASMTTFVFSVTEAGTGITCEKELTLEVVGPTHCADVPSNTRSNFVGVANIISVGFNPTLTNAALYDSNAGVQRLYLYDVKNNVLAAITSVVTTRQYGRVVWSPLANEWVTFGTDAGNVERWFDSFHRTTLANTGSAQILPNIGTSFITLQPGLVVSPTSGLAYGASQNRVASYNTVTRLAGAQAAAVSVNQFIIGSIDIDDTNGLVFASAGWNNSPALPFGANLYVYNAATMATVHAWAIPNPSGHGWAAGCGFCPDNGKVYVCSNTAVAGFGANADVVYVIEPSTGVVEQTIALGDDFFQIVNGGGSPWTNKCVYNPASHQMCIQTAIENGFGDPCVIRIICCDTNTFIGTITEGSFVNWADLVFASVTDTLPPQTIDGLLSVQDLGANLLGYTFP